MAIKINAGAAPRLGRITMPQGTYLSDQAPFSQPTTAASGGLGTGGSGLPPLPPNPFVQPPPQASPLAPVQNAFSQVWDSLKRIDQQMKDSYAEQNRNAPTVTEIKEKYGDKIAGYYEFMLGITGKNTNTTNAFNKNAPSNDLVGSNIASIPAGLPGHQVKLIFPGLTDAQIVQEMQAKGYTRSYQPGVGDYWIKTGEGTATTPSGGGAQGGSIDARGRPEFVDPTLLARGERVTTQSGTTFVGGTPTASGQAQYAVTYAGGVSDERYKWAERTTQDRDGNWVKVYSRELRKTYTRGHRKRKQQRAEEEAQVQAVSQELPQASVTVSPPVGYSQLVNLRADFG